MWTIGIFALLGLALSIWMSILDYKSRDFDFTNYIATVFAILIFSIIGMLISKCIPSKTYYKAISTNEIVCIQDSLDHSLVTVGTINGSEAYTLIYDGGPSGYQMRILPYDRTIVKYITGKPTFIEYKRVPDPDVFINNFSTNYGNDYKYEILIPKGTLINISKKDSK